MATHLRRGALEFRPRQGSETEAAETVLILEKQRQPQRVVGPANPTHAGARGIGAEIEHVVRFTQRDVHLATIGEPAGVARLAKPLVGELDAAEIRLQRLVLRRAPDRVGRRIELAPHRRPLLGGGLTQFVHPVLPLEIAQQADHLVVVGDGPLVREADEERGGARRAAGGRTGADRAHLEPALTDGHVARAQHLEHAGERVGAGQRHRIVPDLVPALVEGASGEARPPGQAVRLDVEAERVGAVGERGAGIGEDLGRLGEAGPPGPLIHRERLAHPLPRQPRHGIGALAVRHCRSVAIADRDVDMVDARTHRDELLVNHALVGPDRLLQRTHAHRLVGRELSPGAAVGTERHLHVILGGEATTLALERERVVGEGQREHGQRGIGRRIGEVAQGRDERQRGTADHESHGSIRTAGVEQRDNRPGIGARARRRARRGAAPRCAAQEQRHHRWSHLLNLKSGR